MENAKENRKIESSNLILDGLLKKAIGAYLEGFEIDWRDAYPGINAITLMEIADSGDFRIKKLLPVVKYSLERKFSSKNNLVYWDYATLLEIAILEKNTMK